jgi:hypothetical protein
VGRPTLAPASSTTQSLRCASLLRQYVDVSATHRDVREVSEQLCMQISIAIPGQLKQQLIEDHDTVKQDKNIPMPRSPCIISILDSYKEHARQQQSTTPDIDEQVAHGIRNYFDRTLALVRLHVIALLASTCPCFCRADAIYLGHRTND